MYIKAIQKSIHKFSPYEVLFRVWYEYKKLSGIVLRINDSFEEVVEEERECK